MKRRILSVIIVCVIVVASAGDVAVGNASWIGVYNKFASSSHFKNYSGMRNQYDCHYCWAALKSEWNLDTWRPDPGYWQTVAAACNP